MRCRSLCIALVLFSCSPFCWAGESVSTALDRFSLGVGSFSNRLQIAGRIDGEAEFDGSSRDFDETLQVGNRQGISLFELSWLIGEAHQIDLRHYADSRSRSAAIDEPLDFNGETFPVQAELHGRAAFQVDELAYAYWFDAASPTPIGLQVGVLRLSGRLALSGRIEIDEVGTAEGRSEVSEHVYAPLVGLSLRHAFGERWRTYAETRLMRLSINGVHGDAISARAGVEYFPTRHLGLALQFGGSEVSARQRKPHLAGRLEVGFSGPQLLLRLRF